MSFEKKLREKIENIAKSIPGFKGYYEKEERREDEKKIREKVADEVREIKDILDEKGRKITKSGNLKPLDRLGQVGKRLEKLKDSIIYADYGYSGFFDRNRISEDTLHSIYKADIELLQWVENFTENTDEETDIEEIAENIEEGFNLLKRRTEIIEGV